MAQAKKTATYRVVTDAGGGRSFRFYCDLSGELCCVTKPLRADTEQAALALAWETEGPVALQPLPGVRPVRLLRHVQRQRGAVPGLCAVGERVPLVLPPLRRPPAGTGRLLLPRLRGEIAGGPAQTERRKPPNDRL